ncbi:response regulator [Paenibacillus sp. LHD-117]|uniref:response regulator transcription factor n=1 Tax=Paenibacillus sp. LHD-117 TaxID=3071412 RepID=UPI0027E03566|nr:response regulator [Paenibacillus sp. LHD-117]MDQ6419547.1 response regulator [Paenibacillus sp. LHD-117]
MKYKVLLVDDEKWVLKHMRSSIDWEVYGFEIVGEARNGIEGLEEIARLKPHLVITDVRMPGIDGLDLIRRAKRVTSHTSFLVASGYAEFEYARQAVNEGALGYCLKPFDQHELIEILDKFKKTQAETENRLHMELLHLLSDRFDNEAYLAEVLTRLGLEWNSNVGLLVLAVIGQDEHILNVRIPHIRLPIGKEETMYLFGAEHEDEIYSHMQERLSGPSGTLGIGLSSRVLELFQLRGAYLEAEEAAYQYFITGKRGIWRPVAGSSWTEVKELLQKMGSKVNPDIVYTVCEQIRRFAAQGTFGIIDALRLYNLYFGIYNEAEAQDEFVITYEQLVRKYGNLEHMLKELMQMASMDHELVKEKGEVKHVTLQRILQFMEDHFTEDLSLTGVSKQFFVNPSYLSQLFRKELNKTFMQFLMDKRLAYACMLLNQSDLTIYEVSEKSGYPNYFYFAKIFKKTTGKTPTQYRKEPLGEMKSIGDC